jgi:hypothetical protein
VSASIFLLYSQTIPLLLATLLSINSTNLSLYDAHFSVAVASSPMSVYVVFRVWRSLFYSKNRDGDAKRQASQADAPSEEAGSVPPPQDCRNRSDGSPETKAVILCLGLTLPLLWLSVSVVTSFSPTAFRNSSDYCGQRVTFPLYLEFLFASSMTGVLGDGPPRPN